MKPTYHKLVTRFACAVLLSTAAISTARADFKSTLLSHNPLGFWEFNEAGTTSAFSKITNATAAGHLLDGYGTGVQTNGVTGKLGTGTGAFFSNPVGAGHVGAKMDVPWNAVMNPNPPFSIEFWAKPNSIYVDSTGAGECPISNFNPNYYTGSRVGWLFYLGPNGNWNFRLGLTSGYAANLVASSGLGQAGVWQYMAATYDGTNVLLYANGTLISSAVSVASSTGWVPNTGSPLRFGGTPLNGDTSVYTADGDYFAPAVSFYDNAGNHGWDGTLDDAAIYAKLLSPAQITAHYNAATTNTAGYSAQILADGPVAYWPMRDAAVTPPSPASLPVVSNLGVDGTAADGTNEWGTLIDQPGPFSGISNASFFNGVSGYVQIKDDPALHFSGNITMAAWVKPAANDFYRSILQQGFDGFDAENFLRIDRGYGVGDGEYYEVGSCDGEDGFFFYDSALAPMPAGDIGNWVFIVGTFDGTNWNLYRNGVLAASYFPDGDGDVGAVSDLTNRWVIGSVSDPTIGHGQFFDGSIAEPAIFNTALSASDIAALYASANIPPILTAPPANPGTVFQGSTVNFSVVADGAPTLQYMWTSNGIPAGDATTSYSIPNIAVGTYTVGVIVSNAYGTNSASVTFSVVNQPPFITTQPVPEKRFVGDPFTLSVTAGGSAPLTYFWKLGAATVQAGTSPTYTTTASLANGGSYTVVVSNSTLLTVTSSPVAVTVLAVPSNYPAAVVASSPIAYYRLDESNGTTCFDFVGGNNGVYTSTTLGVPGYSVIDPDTAVSFSGVNSYVGSISGTAINFTGHTNFTLEAWVNAPSGLNDQSTVIAKGIGNNGTEETEQFAVDVASGVYRFFVTKGGNVTAVSATDGPNGTWQHVVGVYDDTGSQKMYIYVNGTQEGVGPYVSTGLNTTTSEVTIGSKRTGNDPTYDGVFSGSIDEVAIYNTALDSGTITTHFQSAYGTTLAPFITLQPVASTNYVGLPITLTVEAAGSFPLSYQWYQGANAIGGATLDTYTVGAASPSDAGNYHVLISNGIGSTNSATVPLVVLAAPTSPPFIPGLVMHLTFDTNLVDATGRGNNGTGKYTYIPTFVDTNLSYASNALAGITNTVAPALNSSINPDFYYVSDGSEPVPGTALHYNTDAIELAGSSSIGTNDYYVSLGERPDLQFGSNSFSVSYWIRLPPNYLAGDLPFFTDTPQSTGGNGFVFAPAYGYGTASPNPTTPPANYGGWAASIYGNSAGVRLYGDLGSINDGGWHSLVHVIDRSADHLYTYLDGALAHYSLISGTTLDASGNINVSTGATIGQDPTGLYGEAGSADIDDIGVWNRALTPLEAGSIYVAAIGNPGNPLSFSSVTTVPLGPITIKVLSASQVQLSWDGSAVLQSATSAAGPYTTIVGATSPYTVSSTGTKFYRTKL